MDDSIPHYLRINAVKLQNRGLLIGGIIAAFACGGGLYASPYFTLYQMYQAVERKDIQAISSHVNFPALRESVKTNLQTVVKKETSQQSNPLMGLLGSVMGGFVLDPVVDQLVTPLGVAALLEGQQLKLGKQEGQTQFTQGSNSSSSTPDVKAEYESFNQFAVSVKPKGQEVEPVTILLSRDGLGWKISGVRLPSSLAFAKDMLPKNAMPQIKGIEGEISKFLKGGI
jgi:Protein of unknown function (DUF2939)